MILDPIVIAVIKAEDGSVELTLDVPPELTHFAGHFPAHPLLPGVIEVDWAVRLAETHFALPRQRFSQLRNVKFTRPIRPGERLVCRLAWEAAAGRLGVDGRGQRRPSDRAGADRRRAFRRRGSDRMPHRGRRAAGGAKVKGMRKWQVRATPQR